MRSLAIVLMMGLLASCASPGVPTADAEQRAARNRCESMRSYRPYYPGECGEGPGGAPYGYYYQ
jgi:hypothetical protein